MFYIDGFVIVVLLVNCEQFFVYVCRFDLIFLEVGVICVMECWGDDVFSGKFIDFCCVVQVKDDEVVVFFWVEWFDKVMCDVGVEKFMKDLCMSDVSNMLFDGKCMIFGGFVLVVSLLKQCGGYCLILLFWWGVLG